MKLDTPDLPPFIVPNEWKDPDATDLARRVHPYGIEAWTDRKDGQWRIYPSREAAKADGAHHARQN